MSEASLVERLRARFVQSNPCYLDGLSKEAADAIDSLTAEVAGLRVALDKLANEVEGLNAFANGVRAAIGNTNYRILMDRCQAAHQALGPAVEPTTWENTL